MSTRFDFRHAVMLTDDQGMYFPDSLIVRAFAYGLLVEWGQARGGADVSGLLVQHADFDHWTGYAVEFVHADPESEDKYIGSPAFRSYLSRLAGRGCFGNEQLSGREEVFIVTDPSR